MFRKLSGAGMLGHRRGKPDLGMGDPLHKTKIYLIRRHRAAVAKILIASLPPANSALYTLNSCILMVDPLIVGRPVLRQVKEIRQCGS